MNFKSIFKKQDKKNNIKIYDIPEPFLTGYFDIYFFNSNHPELYVNMKSLEKYCRSINANEDEKILTCHFLENDKHNILQFLKNSEDPEFLKDISISYFKNNPYGMHESISEFHNIQVINPHKTIVNNYVDDDCEIFEKLIVCIQFSYTHSTYN